MFQVYQQEHEKTCCYNLCFSSLLCVSKAFNLASTFTALSLLAKRKAFFSTLIVFKPYQLISHSRNYRSKMIFSFFKIQTENSLQSNAKTDFDKLPVPLSIPPAFCFPTGK